MDQVSIKETKYAHSTIPSDCPSEEIEFIFHSRVVPGKQAWQAASIQVIDEPLASDRLRVLATLHLDRTVPKSTPRHGSDHHRRRPARLRRRRHRHPVESKRHSLVAPPPPGRLWRHQEARRYGPFRELARLGPIPLGGAVRTSAGRLPFRGILRVAGISLFRVSTETSTTR